MCELLTIAFSDPSTTFELSKYSGDDYNNTQKSKGRVIPAEEPQDRHWPAKAKSQHT